MPVKIKPTSVIKARLGIEPNGKAQKFFTETCYRYMDKYVPKDNGDLRNEHSLTANSITYEMPYAHYQYIGKLYVMDNGKGAYYSPDYGFWSKKPKYPTDIPLKQKTGEPYWDKQMVSAEIDDVVKEVQNYINRGGK